MSTEFQDAAQGEYEDYVRQPRMNVGTVRDRIAEAFMDAAHWARRYEAGREVTDAEVKVVARAIFEVRDDAYDLDEWEELTSADREPYECDARAALTAARAVRLAEMEDV